MILAGLTACPSMGTSPAICIITHSVSTHDVHDKARYEGNWNRVDTEITHAGNSSMPQNTSSQMVGEDSIQFTL